eukprot:CAMPEP_0195089976 /NCGR_PEP_ID=MMETSP0448-20130528/29115_1 /TAXON_ID=66468 /ORGANISM="Heterocapsa triquestra, Strain CCMP 448" /LENGTH=162 /DNA_ID=CAMNT_0040123765 /DNA_START=1 /DNA_END=486 /DNA_ORIENTATION=+
MAGCEAEASSLLEQATRAKQEANAMFASQARPEAVEAWRRSLRLLADVPHDFPGAQELRLSVSQNLAQCFLDLKDDLRAAFYAGEALAIDPRSTKALYRRALALQGLGEKRKACLHLRRALLIEPDEPKVRQALKGYGDLREQLGTPWSDGEDEEEGEDDED